MRESGHAYARVTQETKGALKVVLAKWPRAAMASISVLTLEVTRTPFQSLVAPGPSHLNRTSKTFAFMFRNFLDSLVPESGRTWRTRWQRRIRQDPVATGRGTRCRRLRLLDGCGRHVSSRRLRWQHQQDGKSCRRPLQQFTVHRLCQQLRFIQTIKPPQKDLPPSG